MSMTRKITRQVAKDRLAAMGIKHINKNFGQGIPQHKNRVYQRTEHGRYILAKLRKERPALWRRVTKGDLAKAAYRAQMGIGPKRTWAIVH